MRVIPDIECEIRIPIKSRYFENNAVLGVCRGTPLPHRAEAANLEHLFRAGSGLPKTGRPGMDPDGIRRWKRPQEEHLQCRCAVPQ